MKTVSVILLIAVTVLAACGAATPTAAPAIAEPAAIPTTVTAVPPTVAPTASPTPTDTPTVPPTATTEPTATPEPEPTATPAAGSFQLPVPMGQGQQLTVGLGHQVIVTVTSVLTGTQALEVVNRGNDYLPEAPSAGNQFAAVQVAYAYLTAPDDHPEAIELPVNGFLGWGLAADNQTYGSDLVLSTEILAANLLPGGVTDGWLFFEIPETAVPHRLRYDFDILGSGVTWFAVDAP